MPENPLAALARLDPELMEHLKRTDELVYSDGAVPRKMKLLIAMAFDAAHGAVSGVRALAGQAKAAGATNQEMAEVLRVACHLNGVGALYAASAALKEPD